MSKAVPRPGEITLPEDPESLAEFEALLAYLKQSRGFDFTAYKRSSLMRRVMVRMQTMGVEGIQRLSRFPAGRLRGVHPALQHHPHQRHELLPRYRQLGRGCGTRSFPRMTGPPDSSALIRVWSAGCASGEEAYSIAMLLAEAMGPEAFRERVKIYATDVDEDALNQARHAVYGARTAEDVPAPLLEKYFDRQEEIGTSSTRSSAARSSSVATT